MTTLIWLRDDLRLADHPALTAACAAAHGPVVALWIHETRRTDEENNRHGPRPLGAAARWWYHRSLQQLAPRLANLGIPLVLARGDAANVMRRVVDTVQPTCVHWTRRYAPAACRLDAAIKQELNSRTEVHSHPGSLLVEPWLIQTANGSHYQVFTPFSRAVADLPLGALLPEPSPIDAPDGAATALATLREDGVLQNLEDLGLLDDGPAWWDDTLEQHWEPGELAARQQLDAIDGWLPGYAKRRDLPGEERSTSRISPRLRCGELSPRQALTAARSSTAAGEDIAAWTRQLYWREFCWHLLHYRGDLEDTPMRSAFAEFPYRPDDHLARAWRQGRTGIDLVDGGMWQLWQAGWMHNRVRMVAASLFTKNMLQPWQDGERWFWDTLVDADEAINPVSWQWVAGSGADAAPYFRIFNPELQRSRFDPRSCYVERWIPAGLDRPIVPVVNLAESRREALAAHQQVSAASAADARPERG